MKSKSLSIFLQASLDHLFAPVVYALLIKNIVGKASLDEEVIDLDVLGYIPGVATKLVDDVRVRTDGRGFEAQRGCDLVGMHSLGKRLEYLEHLAFERTHNLPAALLLLRLVLFVIPLDGGGGRVIQHPGQHWLCGTGEGYFDETLSILRRNVHHIAGSAIHL